MGLPQRVQELQELDNILEPVDRLVDKLVEHVKLVALEYL